MRYWRLKQASFTTVISGAYKLCRVCILLFLLRLVELNGGGSIYGYCVYRVIEGSARGNTVSELPKIPKPIKISA